MHASNAARIEQSYQDIADQVKLAGRNDPQADVFKLVHNWLRNEKNGRWLLVLDNADDASDDDKDDDDAAPSSSSNNSGESLDFSKE